MKCFSHCWSGLAFFPGFWYHQIPFEIHPVVTRSGRPSWLTYSAKLMALPIPAKSAGILIPIGAAENVDEPIAIHIEKRDAFSVIGAEAVREKGGLHLAIRAWSWSGLAVLGSVCRVLGICGGSDSDKGEG